MPMRHVDFAECDLCEKRGPESPFHSGAIDDAEEAGWFIHIDYNTQHIDHVLCPDCLKEGDPAFNAAMHHTAEFWEAESPQEHA